MKVALKLIFATVLGTLAVLIIFGWVRAQREVELFDSDMRRDHLLVGSTLAVCVADEWVHVGPHRALQLVREADEERQHLRLGFVHPDGTQSAIAPGRILEHRAQISGAVREVHGREQVRLLEQKPRRLALEQGHVVPVEARRIEARAFAHGVPDHGVERETAAHRLLHEVPALERAKRRLRVIRGARELGQRLGVHVVTLDVSQHRKHAPALDAETRPGPIDEQRDLGQIVFVLDRDDARHAASLQEVAQRLDVDGARGDQAVGDVEREGAEAQGAGERLHARERALSEQRERGGDGKHQHAR